MTLDAQKKIGRQDRIIKLDELKPYEFNNRNHPAEQVEQIAKSLQEFGWTNPILVDEDMSIIAGHGRYLASLKLGMTEAPCVILSGMTEEKKRAYRILDNKLTEDSTWAMDNLSLEVGWLEDQGFDVAEWGLDDLVEEWNEEQLEAEDDGYAGEVPSETFLKLGDLLELGEHRVLCGDSTDAEQVAELMQGKKAVLLQTDPPYGIAYVSNAKSKGQAKNHEEIENDELDGEMLQDFLERVLRAALPHLTKTCAYYLWHPMLTQGTFFAAAAAAADILIHRQIIWVKPSLVFGRGDYHWQHELCFYGWVKGNRPPFYGARNQTTIWQIGRETSKDHPTAKPVELWEAPFNNHTKKGEVCYEPFLGSGSQLIAADQLGRICYGMEISPQYCHVILDRYIAHCLKSNKKADVKINGEIYNPVS